VNLAQKFLQAFAPQVAVLSNGTYFDLRRRYWPPHRPVGTPKRFHRGVKPKPTTIHQAMRRKAT
jgi:hypothetical protein